MSPRLRRLLDLNVSKRATELIAVASPRLDAATAAAE